MSFSYEVKTELCKSRPSGCCRFAQMYGLLLFGRSFSSNSISILTEHTGVAEMYAYLLKRSFDVGTLTEEQGNKRKMYKVRVSGAINRRKVINFYKTENEINADIIKASCCKTSFLKGAFLACGSINDPNKDYRVEFVISNEALRDSFINFLNDFDLSPRVSKRSNSYVIYFKDSEQIETLLAKMDASHYSLELMGIKVYKDMRNRVNRLSNCETANISKTVNASVEQMEAIRYLEDTGELYMLPAELVSAAMLRKINPDSSLNELCKRSCEPITRSGLNHRLQKIVAIAKIVRQEEV